MDIIELTPEEHDPESYAIPHVSSNVRAKMMELKGIDNQIKKLLQELKSSENLALTDLEKSYAVFALNKIKLSLIFIDRLEQLVEAQMMIEMKIFDPSLIDQLSLNELLEINKISVARIDNYFEKIDNTLRSVNIAELQNTLLLIAEHSKKAQLVNDPDNEEANSMTQLSIELLKSVTDYQANNDLE